MTVELAPLLAKMQSQTGQRGGTVRTRRMRWLQLAVSEKSAPVTRAEVVIEHAQPKLLVSAGMAGAISPQLKVGDVGRIREVVDVATGDRYLTRGGDWVLATSQDVSDAAEKQTLLTKYGADVVDMEGAAEAQVAKERGLEFAAVKAISDDASFVMPPLNRFIDGKGKFDTRQFSVLCSASPEMVGRFGKNKEE